LPSFGGNSSSVMIFGESAGGMSVSVHLVSPLSAGLFQKAIMESNPVTECHSYNTALNSGSDFAKKVGCDPADTKCLRALNASTVLENGSGGSWEATIDGTVGGQQLPDYPLNLFKAGKYNRNIPTILGTNKHEEAIFLAYFFERPMSADEYTNVVTVTYGKTAPQVLALYPAQQNYDNRITLAYLTTHQSWACPGAQIVLNINKYNSAANRGYVYYFEHIDSFPNWHEPICGEAVCHAEELAFVWNTVNFTSHDLIHMTPEEEVLTYATQTYWGTFTATGIPSAPGQPAWAAFEPSSNTSIVLDCPCYSSPGHIQKYCNFWDAQPALPTYKSKIHELVVF